MSGRSSQWIGEVATRGEFVVGGITRAGPSVHSLLIVGYGDGLLHYVGEVELGVRGMRNSAVVHERA
jgi:hypothetical protein